MQANPVFRYGISEKSLLSVVYADNEYMRLRITEHGEYGVDLEIVGEREKLLTLFGLAISLITQVEQFN